jgi:phthiocerol/phenolphthiocerol synthesis type-I polyketide synthase C
MHADPNIDQDRLVAVVGMAGRLPGAGDIDSFWQLLAGRGDAIRPVPAERWDATAQLDPHKPVQAEGGFLDRVDEFDPTFFGISPREAEDIDPQQRLMLEATWRALEDAGEPAANLRGSRTGVYVGASWHDYEILRKDRGAGATQHSAVGNALDVVAARVSYFLKLTGPSLTVETGCSSSLVALHLANQGLRDGDLDAAIVGGVNLILAPDVSIGLTHFGGLSPDARCKAFAASANGFVRGEGVAALYLKTLRRALDDGDRIHGVIAATVVNNDGGGESLVTPNPAGQEDLLRRAYADGRVPLDRLAYVEAHGTGTLRGDPIETGAIGRVLGRHRDPAAGPLAIGSVKTNIGHLEAAAGMAGLLKCLLVLRHRLVPPTLHADALNPEIPFDELNLHVVREPHPLPDAGPVYVGVNSFGWGGTNAHVVLMSPPEPVAEPPVGGPVLVPVSAHRDDALRQRVTDLAAVAAAGGVPLGALAGTLAWQRDHFPTRAAFVATDTAGLADSLTRFAGDPAGEYPEVVTGRPRGRGRTAFVFPGQGAQWIGMGQELYRHNATFAATVRRCAAALEPHFPWDMVGIIAGTAGDEWTTRIDMIQPTLWAVSVGLAEAWRAAGVEPDVVVGHSQGEVTAATVAGILSYEDAALVIARRSAIARRTSGRGRMLAVDLDVAGAQAALEGFEGLISLAVNNGPMSCVLSGDTDAVLTLKEILDAEGTFCRLVNVDYASHSPQMDELREEMLQTLGPVRPKPGTIALMSTVQVRTLDGPEMGAEYWAANLRRPVLFADAMAALFDDGVTHVVEISPHPILTPAIEQLAALRPEPPAVLSTLRRDNGTARDLVTAFARAYVSGLTPFGTLPRHASVDLPGYPWQRGSYWVGERRRRGGARSGLDVTLQPAATEPDVWEGRLELATDANPWLADHKVHDAVVLPGAAMLALALAAGRARTLALPRTLVDVRFHSDLTLADDTARVSVAWRDDVTDGGSFTLLSLPDGASTWTRHATARVLGREAGPASAGPGPAAPADPASAGPASAGPAEVEFPAELADGVGATTLDVDEFYAAWADRGLNYGPAFQAVRRLLVRGDAALGEVRLGEPWHHGARPHGLHPALWDGALQVSLALCGADTAVVPVAIRRVRVRQDPAEPVTGLWSYAVRRSESTVDLYLFDTARRPLLVMEGLELQVLAVTGGTVAETDRIHRMSFVEQERPEPATREGTWVVCACSDGAGAGLAGELVAALAEAGHRVDTLDGGGDPADRADRLRAYRPLAGVVFVAPPAMSGLTAQRRGLLTLAELARACSAQATAPQLVVVTANAQSVEPAVAPDPGAALYWGFTRVLRREHGELSARLIDTDPADEWWTTWCVAELLTGDDEDQVVIRDDRRLVGRLVRGRSAAEAERPPWRTARQPFRLVPDRPGLWDGLAFRPLTRRPPAAGEIEVEVEASALNFIDVMKAMGTYPDPVGADLLGGECAGRVVAVGAGVDGFAAGDRVVACAFGSIASHATVRAEHARHIPESMDAADAAALPLVTLTAWYALVDLARLTAGETVLIHSATGGLGLAGIEVARSNGAEIIATAGSEPKREYLRGLGIRHVFDSRDLSWADGVRAVTGGRGVDVVLNSLTGAAIPLGLDALAEDGRFIEVGKKDIYRDRTIGMGAFRKGISLASVDLAGLMDRRPERFARLFTNVWDAVCAGTITSLPVIPYPFGDAAEALRAMSHGNHIGKFVLTDPGSVRAVAPEPMPAGRFRADGTYLISGGLGALGLSLAGYLAEHGAGAIALLARSAPTAPAAAAIESLRAKGVRVTALAADVDDPASLRAALSTVERPLRGVVHAAGLLDDATIANLTAGQLDRVLAPKVGARHLDELTRDEPLDFFVLFSSAASLIGNAGQAAYSAGNAYLDALAHARRASGLPALAVQWGPFAEIGLAAQDGNRGARLEERGMGSFPVTDAWPALARFLDHNEPVIGYVPLHLRRWFDAYPDTAAQRSWQLLRQAAQAGTTGTLEGESFVASLRSGPPEARTGLAEAKVRELAGRVLRMDPRAIDCETPFKALGLDSLMGLELRNRLETTFGLRLSPTFLWTYGCSRVLADVLCERLFSDDAS